MFGICSGVFAPSAKLRLSLLNHLITIEESECQEISQRACYCISRLEKIYENGTRLILPTIEEIKCMKPYPVKIYTSSGSSIVILLESFDNSKDLKIAIIKKLKLPSNKFPLFGIYEIFEDKFYEERYIEENELIMDLISSWENKTIGSYKLVFKIRLYIYQGIKDQILPFAYIQCTFDILRGITLITGKIMPVLAAIKIYIELGKSQTVERKLTIDINHYVSEIFLKNNQLTNIE